VNSDVPLGKYLPKGMCVTLGENRPHAPSLMSSCQSLARSESRSCCLISMEAQGAPDNCRDLVRASARMVWAHLGRFVARLFSFMHARGLASHDAMERATSCTGEIQYSFGFQQLAVKIRYQIVCVFVANRQSAADARRRVARRRSRVDERVGCGRGRHGGLARVHRRHPRTLAAR
jgi:hypothetical protein